jgi:3-methylcrotonyl-CoA carboxylase alpha subunit
MFSSVLIANRGEIACRIIRTARRMGMRTIAVHSDADAGALFTREADEALPIGPAAPALSYLAVDRIVEAAQRSGAQCVHPGYGFLSENAAFAEACAAAGLVFIGPPPAAIRAMGLKDAAKALVEKAGVPVVPGYHGQRQDASFLRERAGNIGFPVLIKAVAGGGGKGMRRVDRLIDFEEALAGAQREAQAAFGDPRVLVERYVRSPRHIEIQVMADLQGNAVHLWERDCSLQRRHQKVIEEAPAPGMTAAVRAAMGEAAVRAARAVGYAGAGTVEFIVDGSRPLSAEGFFFMEMNTRLQVEHPVTEAITGLDLVELQFRVASGEPLSFTQEDVAVDGHAVEARLYAEDPAAGFLPSAGKLHAFDMPEGEGIRVDAGYAAGDIVPSDYDPMLAKIVAHGIDRAQALGRLADALSRTFVAGPRTNLALLEALCRSPDVLGGKVDTGLVERQSASLAPPVPVPAGAIAAAAATLLGHEGHLRAGGAGSAGTGWEDPWNERDGFQLAGPWRRGLPLLVDGESVPAVLEAGPAGLVVRVAGSSASEAGGYRLVRTGDELLVVSGGRQASVRLSVPGAAAGLPGASRHGAVKAPMHGRIVAVYVEDGDVVEPGERIAVVEAMKMEHTLVAPRAGTIDGLTARAGSQVAQGDILCTVADA